MYRNPSEHFMPIWFSSHIDDMDFCHCLSYNVHSIQVLYISLHKQLQKEYVELRVHSVVRFSFLSKLGWKELKSFFVEFLISSWLLDQIGWLFGKVQIISYTFRILKHIQIN